MLHSFFLFLDEISYIYRIHLIYAHISQLSVVQRQGSNFEWCPWLRSWWDPQEFESRARASGGWDR